MSNKIFVTVFGADRVGIVAEITAELAKCETNIEDIKQTLMQGHFVMFMLCDIEKSSYSFKEIKESIMSIGAKLGMEVWVQKKEIFDNMHKI